jgi:hypothetical protein
MVAEGAANNLQVFILIFAFMIDSKLLLLSLLGMLFIDRGFSPVQKVICSTIITLRHYKEKTKKAPAHKLLGDESVYSIIILSLSCLKSSVWSYYIYIIYTVYLQSLLVIVGGTIVRYGSSTA